jgi:hypothetical protein
MPTLTADYRVAHVLRVKASSLADAIVAEHYRLRPELELRYRALGRRRCLEDACFHLNFLAGSVEFGDPRVFADYANWAADLLARRNILSRDLADNFRVVAQVLQRELPADVSNLCQIHVTAALDKLHAADDQSTGRPDALSRTLPQKPRGTGKTGPRH